MAKLVKTMMLSMLVLVCSCTETETISTYYFENRSGVDVYIPEYGPYKRTIFIENDETNIMSGSAMGADSYSPFDHAESIDVIFGGNKIIHYERFGEEDPMNPLRSTSYLIIDKTKKHNKYVYKYYYTFTVEQYESAEPYEP